MAWKYHQKGRRTRLLEGCEVRKMKEYAPPTDSRQQEEAVSAVHPSAELSQVGPSTYYLNIYIYAYTDEGHVVALKSANGATCTLTYSSGETKTFAFNSIITNSSSTCVNCGWAYNTTDTSGVLHIPAGAFLLDGEDNEEMTFELSW